MKSFWHRQGRARTATGTGRRVKRTVAAGAAGLVLATGMTALATPAQAASKITFTVSYKSDGSAKILVRNNGAVAGVVLWAADPDSYPYTTDNKGDTLYVRDQYRDGYAISGTVVQASGAPKHYRSVSTSGHTADYSVRKTQNLAEGHKLQLRAQVLQGSKVIRSSVYYKIRA